MTHILFICKANRFRSKIAEAYFKKINKNKDIEVRSAGIIPGNPPIHAKTKKVLRDEFDLIIKGKPKGINMNLIRWANTIVIVADDVPSILFDNEHFKGKLIVWKIKDAHHNNIDGIRRAARQIILKVNGLVKDLK